MAKCMKELERYRKAVPIARGYIEALKKFSDNDEYDRAIDNTLEIMDNTFKWVNEVESEEQI